MGLTEDLKLRFVAWLRENKDVSRVRGVGGSWGSHVEGECKRTQ